LKTSFLLLLLASVGIGQTPQIESSDVERVGAHIACQCGGCKESVSCPMAKRGCGFCVPAKAKIYKMQAAGLSDSAIIDTYKKEFGDKVYLADPSSFFWLTPTLVICWECLVSFTLSGEINAELWWRHPWGTILRSINIRMKSIAR